MSAAGSIDSTVGRNSSSSGRISGPSLVRAMTSSPPAASVAIHDEGKVVFLVDVDGFGVHNLTHQAAFFTGLVSDQRHAEDLAGTGHEDARRTLRHLQPLAVLPQPRLGRRVAVRHRVQADAGTMISPRASNLAVRTRPAERSENPPSSTL